MRMNPNSTATEPTSTHAVATVQSNETPFVVRTACPRAEQVWTCELYFAESTSPSTTRSPPSSTTFRSLIVAAPDRPIAVCRQGGRPSVRWSAPHHHRRPPRICETAYRSNSTRFWWAVGSRCWPMESTRSDRHGGASRLRVGARADRSPIAGKRSRPRCILRPERPGTPDWA